MERFQVTTPATVQMAVPQEEINPLFPMTLDLRLPARVEKPPIEKPGSVS
jgi:hypothetical protein